MQNGLNSHAKSTRIVVYSINIRLVRANLDWNYEIGKLADCMEQLVRKTLQLLKFNLIQSCSKVDTC